jgi:hypothetical protein
MTSDTNRLILSIAHRPMQDDVLEELIAETSTSSKRILAEIESAAQREPKNTQRHTLHVLLTGSPCITLPGKSLDDWDTKWTSGERIFAKYINAIGLNKFHRVPRQGEARLNGKLVDVKQNDFTYDETASVKEQLEKELLWIAINVKQHFNLYASAPVSDVVILYPISNENEGDDSDHDPQQGEDEIVGTINHIFQKEWTQKDGPLAGIEITVQTVKAHPDL